MSTPALRKPLLASVIFIMALGTAACPATPDDDLIDAGEDVVEDISHDDTSDGDASHDTGEELDAEPDAELDAERDAEPHTDADVIEEPEPVDPCEDPVPADAIEAVDLSTGLFIGQPSGFDGASAPSVLVDSFEEYAQHFGIDPDDTLDEDDALEWSVSLFFENGGEEAWIYPTEADVPTQMELAGVDLPPGLLVIPGLSTIADEADRSDAFDLLGGLLERDEHRHVFFVGELPQSWSIAEIGDTEPKVPLDFYGNQVAIYHPWLQITADDQSIAVGPAGAVAGIFARTDRSRGEWKAPAGLDAELEGVESLDQDVSASEQEIYVEGFVNALRVLDEEPVIWGARTRENPAGEGQYISVRRLTSLIETSVLQGTHFAAWEPYEEEDLWDTLADKVESFLDGLFLQGALQGTTASEAYFVRVDETTTSVADINRGVAVVELGFAPLRPAEFHILRIEIPVATCL